MTYPYPWGGGWGASGLKEAPNFFKKAPPPWWRRQATKQRPDRYIGKQAGTRRPRQANNQEKVIES